jgi:Cdc6-like AAA superfamily ATPase
MLGLRLDRGSGPLGRGSGRFAVPTETWQRQALVVGETGSGKTMTALTVASEAMRAGWDVYWIDGKADPEVAERFLTLARRFGLAARDGSHDAIDGWRGGAESIVNRLLATQRFTEPYYAGIARNVLRWAVGDDPPASFAELVRRMDKRELRRRWRDDPWEADTIRRLPAPDLLGARYRYEGVAWAVGTTLDGDWSYEDVPAAYVPVGRPEHRDQAAEVGAFLLEDLLHWAMARKPRERNALVVIDEFSKLAARPDAAVDLVERVRSFRVGVVLIGQTWASLGSTDTVRERLAGTVGTIIIHRLKAPERLVALAGTESALERTEHLAGLAPTGRVSQRMGRRFVVSPDDVRALGCGEAFLVTADGAVRLRVRPPALVPA